MAFKPTPPLPTTPPKNKALLVPPVVNAALVILGLRAPLVLDFAPLVNSCVKMAAGLFVQVKPHPNPNFAMVRTTTVMAKLMKRARPANPTKPALVTMALLEPKAKEPVVMENKPV